jgi:hypothetical protein
MELSPHDKAVAIAGRLARLSPVACENPDARAIDVTDRALLNRECAQIAAPYLFEPLSEGDLNSIHTVAALIEAIETRLSSSTPPEADGGWLAF